MKKPELEALAKTLGIKPKSLRMNLYRERLRKRAKSYQEPPFETFGLTLNAAFKDNLRAARRRLELAAQRVGQARIEVERLSRSTLPVPVDQLNTIEGLCLSLEERIAEAMPRSLCPFCKGVDAIQEDCKACKGSGLASVTQFQRAPKKLREEPFVWSNGKELPLEDFAATPARTPFGDEP